MLFEPFQLQLPENFHVGVEVDPLREPEPRCACGCTSSAHGLIWWLPGMVEAARTWTSCLNDDGCPGFWQYPEFTYKLGAWPKPEWEWTLNGCRDIVFCVPSAPNALHRLMQRLVLGIHWSRK